MADIPLEMPVMKRQCQSQVAFLKHFLSVPAEKHHSNESKRRRNLAHDIYLLSSKQSHDWLLIHKKTTIL